jgi:hypothetical protein
MGQEIPAKNVATMSKRSHGMDPTSTFKKLRTAYLVRSPIQTYSVHGCTGLGAFVPSRIQHFLIGERYRTQLLYIEGQIKLRCRVAPVVIAVLRS